MKRIRNMALVVLFAVTLLLAGPACVASASAAHTAPRGENVSAAKTKATAPYRTDIISASATATGIKLKWKLSSNADGYYIYRALPGDVAFTRIKTISKPTTLTCTDTSAKSGKNYYYTIRAFKKSASGSVTEASYNPIGTYMVWLKPPKLSGITDQKGKIQITWTKSPGAAGYLVMRRTGSGSYSLLQSVAGSSTLKYTDVDVEEGKTYQYGVISFRFSFRSVRKNTLKITHRKAVPSGPDTPSKTVYRAVLIGESIYDPDHYLPKYRNDDMSDNLYYSSNDLNAMQRMLAGLNYSTIIARADAGKSQVLSAIRYGFSGADENDVSLFYFTGHGYQETTGSYAGALSLVDSNAITLTELADVLGRIPGKVVVLLDSCGSGAAIHSKADFSSKAKAAGSTTVRSSFNPALFNQQVINVFAAADRTSGIKSSELATGKFQVITASEIGESSIEMNSYGYRGGAFTIGLVEGAGFSYHSSSHTAAMPADKNSDKKITLGEAYSFAAARVRQLTDGDQHVQRYPIGSRFVIYQK